MSYISEYLHGLMDYDEFKSYAQWEDRKERYYLEHQFDEEGEDGDEQDNCERRLF